MTIKAKKSKINLREKLAELLNFRQIRDRLDGLGLYLGKDRTGTAENLAVRGGANVDDLQLAEISAAVGGTAVDVFVYDTRNDSDGGKWRERTSHTSWYNEELNTATRGGRREFPAVAVIVAESDKVTIYDGDDPDLSMWMVFNNTGTSLADIGILGRAIDANTCVKMLNGDLFVGNANHFATRIPFISESVTDFIGRYSLTTGPLRFNGNIAQRNTGLGKTKIGGTPILAAVVNDVAMTVLPNAPIDENTGLPVPTIAVATDGGVSVIRDDGSVVDLNMFNRPYSSVYFSDDYLVWAVENPGGVDYDLLRYFSIPTEDTTTAPSYGPNSNPALFPSNTIGNFFDSFAYGSPVGLTKLDHNSSDVSKSLAAYTTSTYNTGWMPGDIKLATLSDSVVETVGVDETELVTNGTFNTDRTGWTDISDGNYSVIGNELFVEYTTVNSPGVYQDFEIVAGKTYTLSGTSRSSTEGQPTKISIIEVDSVGITYLGDSWSENNRLENSTTSNVLKSGRFLAASSGTIRVRLQSNFTSDAYFDNISVKQTGELITNGTFDAGTTGWTDASSNWSVASGQASSSGSGSLTQTITTIVGETYTISIDAVTIVSPYVRVVVDGAVPVQLDVGYTGTKAGTFTATSTSTTIQINPYASGQTIDNISVRLAELDRSVNDNGLQVFGEITKTPVAPGADLVAYSGFSADDYLMQPYNSDLDFGIGDFSIMFWQKSTTHSGQEVFFDIGENGVFDNRYMFYRSSGTAGIQFWKRVNGVSTVILDVFDVLGVGAYHFIVGTRKDGVFTFYVNGSSVGGIGDTSDLTFSGFNRTCIVGNSVSGTSPVQNMALFRISATAPTPEQIAKIYRDEKPLFQDGAQATLYGTSDAVTALAYDDKTELLHVGTSDGRSDFAGLRRINNTTTAVTTSISASNNLIAEQ